MTSVFTPPSPAADLANAHRLRRGIDLNPPHCKGTAFLLSCLSLENAPHRQCANLPRELVERLHGRNVKNAMPAIAQSRRRRPGGKQGLSQPAQLNHRAVLELKSIPSTR